MKLVAVGFGQCGGRIADEFVRLNRRARALRGLNVIPDAFAVNTDVADLSGLVSIKPDYQHRILIGDGKTSGHGVGKINELAAEIARKDTDKVIENIRDSEAVFEADAVLLIAGAAGGTGSGSIAVMTQQIKERYTDKPVYNLIVLPFEYEEATEARTVCNVATCLKSSYLVADAIFLVDNQRYIRRGQAIKSNLTEINTWLCESFYNLLCAGEEKKPRYIGARMLDAGDIIQTLAGWTTIGYGKCQTELSMPFSRERRDFRKKANEAEKGTRAIDEAISGLSLKCNPADSGRALYLVSACANEINMELLRTLGDHIKRLAPAAVVRGGDYPREKGRLDVTVIMSELSDVEKVRHYFSQAVCRFPASKKQREGILSQQQEIALTFKDIPSLL